MSAIELARQIIDKWSLLRYNKIVIKDYQERGMMSLYQAYAGKILNGKPSILENITLPENTNIIIMVLDELPFIKTNPPSSAVTITTEKAKKAKAIDSLKGIIPAEFEFDLEDIRQERIKKRGLGA